MSKLSSTDRAAVAQNIRHTKLVQASRRLARVVKTVHPSKEALARRARLEKDLSKWLKYYMPDTFPDAWGTVHQQCLSRLQQCIEEGGCFAFAMQRAGGKSSIGKGASVYAPLTGKRKYVVPIGATDNMASEYLEFIRSQLDGTNEIIAADYPEAVGFFKALDGKAINGPHQLDGRGKKTGIDWRARGITFPNVLMPDGKTMYPFSGARIECRGITAAMKGMAKNVGGRIMRPDFVLPDDVQTEDDAMSKIACDKIENKIIGTVLALAGPRRRIACFMPCTIVEKDDVSARFLDRKRHPEFQGERHPMITTWPKAQDTLWAKYAELRSFADDDKTGKQNATNFYKEHQAEMDEGGAVSWESRIRDGEISALETAENLLLEMGRVKFFAEMQQDPVECSGSQYELTAETICTHTVNIPRFHLPPNTTVFTGHCDINQHNGGLHYALAAFDQKMTAHVVDYGHYPERGSLYPKNASTQEKTAAIFNGMKTVCERIKATVFTQGGKRAVLTTLLFDASFESDTVHRFTDWANQNGGYTFRCIPAIGRANHKYFFRKDSLIGKPFENCHLQRAQTDAHKRYIMFNADVWRETMQRAFLGNAGAPGGCTLYAVPDPRQHFEFADHCRAEMLRAKGDVGGVIHYDWTHRPGAAWDWGDALTGCWVAAAASGLSASGQPAAAPVPFRNIRRTRHIAI